MRSRRAGQFRRWKMARGPLLTEAEKAEIGARRAGGEPAWMIARRTGRNRRTVRDLLAATGGVPPHQPQRSRRELTFAEREDLSRGLAVGQSCRALARKLGRASSSVSREVRRNGGREGYRAGEGDVAAGPRRRGPQPR